MIKVALCLHLRWIRLISISQFLLTRVLINAEKLYEFFLLVASSRAENRRILAVFLTLSLFSIALLLKLKLQQIDLLAQDVYSFRAGFQLIGRNLKFISALILLKDGAIVLQLILACGKLCLDLFIEQNTLLRLIPGVVVTSHAFNKFVFARL